MAGLLGWKRKIKRRKDDGQEFYRNAKSTLATRCRKKLLEKTSWYKEKAEKESEKRMNKNQENKAEAQERDKG